MRTKPNDLDTSAIATALSERWGIDGVSLRYAPLGFGSHHWIACKEDGEGWFVTVDDLSADRLGETEGDAFEGLAGAFRTVASLRDRGGLPFVIAPLLDKTGEPITRLNGHYSLAVFPYLDVEATDFGEFPVLADRNEALRMVGQVHSATGEVSNNELRRDTLVVPNRVALLESLEALDITWNAGPYSEPVRILLREHHDGIGRRLDRFDNLAEIVMADDSDWVISHGEPHASNVIRTRDGEMVMVDWDTVAFAPRERDLWMLISDTNPDWTDYADVTGVKSLSNDALDAYRLWWDLSEIAVYVLWCRLPHERTEEMAIAWESLQEYLPN